MNQKLQHNVKEIEELMVFDFSENVLTDASIRSFAELLKKF